MNQGDATLQAQFYDQNQRRADEAARTLNTQGYSATGTSANAQQRAKEAQAGLVVNTGAKIADTGLDVSKDIANKTLTGEQNVATQGLNTATNLSNLAGQYATNKSNLSSGLTNAQVDVTKGKATADAAALGGISNIDYLTNVQAADNMSKAIAPAAETITTAITADKKKTASKSAAAQG